jgi:DNA-binding NarL/FixJ family response regulator
MTHWKTVLLYGAALAAGTLLLQSLDFIAISRAHSGDAVIGIIAFAFLALGVFVGMRLFAAPSRPVPAGNPQAQATLGISGRELDVLRELAAGRSNKEIAARLGVSPNTVKTHVARLFEKLQARRRTEAILKARELGIVG